MGNLMKYRAQYELECLFCTFLGRFAIIAKKTEVGAREINHK